MNRKSIARDLGAWILAGSMLGTLVYGITQDTLFLSIGPALDVVLGSIAYIAKR